MHPGHKYLVPHFEVSPAAAVEPLLDGDTADSSGAELRHHRPEAVAGLVHGQGVFAVGQKLADIYAPTAGDDLAKALELLPLKYTRRQFSDRGSDVAEGPNLDAYHDLSYPNIPRHAPSVSGVLLPSYDDPAKPAVLIDTSPSQLDLHSPPFFFVLPVLSKLNRF